MRPVNLIPPEDRRGDRAPTRTGPIAYVIVGALAAALAAVSAVVLTNNQIADRKGEIGALEAREAAAIERAEALAPFAEFAALKEARVQTVDSLARSRFDWERVLRELAIVIPAGIQLTNVTGTVAPGVVPEGAAANSLRDSIPGPTLEVMGCAPNHEGVAELAASLEDIDGVTRVGVNSSATSGDSAAATTAPAAGGQAGCDSEQTFSQFVMIAAFDEVALAASVTPGVTETGAATEPTSTDPSVADAQAQEAEARNSASEQTNKAKDAAGLIPGVAR